MNQETLETSVKGVYVAGDGLYGPATVVEGIRDGKMAAEAIIGKALAEDLFKLSDAETIYGRKGRLAEENDHVVDSARCLSCNSYCENCVEVCPNRANISLVVPGMEKHQIITWIICATSAATVRASVRGTALPILTNSPCLPTRLTWKTAKTRASRYWTLLPVCAG